MATTWDQLASRLKELTNPDGPGDQSGPAILSKEQGGAITHIVNHFQAVIARILGSTLRDATEETRVKNWLDRKYTRLEGALQSGEALHFDVLLLGIVPIHFDLVLHNIVRTRLIIHVTSSRELSTQFSAGKNALATYQTLYAVSRKAGHRAHVERVINPLIREYDRSHDFSRGDDGANPWRDESAGQLDSETFGQYHPLIQYGIKELLRLIKKKVDAANLAPDGKAEIVRTLNEWTPKRVVKRAKATVRLAETCNEARHGQHSLTSRSSAADPLNLQLMPLPGHPGGLEARFLGDGPTEASNPRSPPASPLRTAHDNNMHDVEMQNRDHSPRPHQRFTLPDLGFGMMATEDAAHRRGLTDPSSHYVGRGHNDRMPPHFQHALGSEPRLSERTARRYGVGADWSERAMRRYDRLVSRLP